MIAEIVDLGYEKNVNILSCRMTNSYPNYGNLGYDMLFVSITNDLLPVSISTNHFSSSILFSVICSENNNFG